MRALLVIVVIAAIAALLWGTWQLGKRLFYLTLAIVVVVVVIWIIASLLTNDERREAMPANTVTITIKSVHPTETSYRFNTEIVNHGSLSVAKVWLDAEALRCPSPETCKQVYHQQQAIPIHVPVKGHYPLPLVVDRPEQSLHIDHWRMRVLRVEGYHP